MFSRFLKIILLTALILTVILPNFRSFAQTSTEEREALEAELKELEEQIAQYEEDITKTKQEKKSLQNEIYILGKRIEQLDYQASRNNLIIKDLNFQIGDTQSSIDVTNLKIDEVKENLANILQLRYEEDQMSLLEIFLAEKSLADFFDDLMALEALNLETQDLLKDIKGLKGSLESQKYTMVEEKDDLENIVTIQLLQKQESAGAKKTQEYFLRLTEAEYQKYLREKEETERKAAAIEARIFELIGVPEAPTFGEALELAKYVEGITGVRPALLLAVLTQESNIGKNVGQCYLKNSKTGDGVVIYNGRKVSRVMKPMGLSGRKGDTDDFLKITKELGKDHYSTPISCPMSYGWGGAMGPAQFIPTTWVIYKDGVKAITGKPADPWNIKDAFLAAALYLKDYGAGKQTYDSEFNAVLSYFAGPSWYKSYYSNVYRRDYGYPVMGLASGYQKDIKAIESTK